MDISELLLLKNLLLVSTWSFPLARLEKEVILLASGVGLSHT
jgi:hypothetical protein